MKETVKSIQTTVRALADKEIAQHSQRFFKTGKGEYGEGDIFLGIRVPVIRKIAKQYKSMPIQEIVKLLQSKYHEERLLAVILMVNLSKKANEKQQKELYTTYLSNTHKINNWDIIDSSAPDIVGKYLFDKNTKPLYTLANSNSLWEKRISILATFYFIKFNKYEDALKIAEIMLPEEHDLIHKATGWMLREIGNRDIETEEKFLKPHYKSMPRTMLRYAIEKFPETKRKKYLHGEI